MYQIQKKKYKKLNHGGCTEQKKVTLAEAFVCKRCKMMTKSEMSVARLSDDVETVERLGYRKNVLSACDGF